MERQNQACPEVSPAGLRHASSADLQLGTCRLMRISSAALCLRSLLDEQLLYRTCGSIGCRPGQDKHYPSSLLLVGTCAASGLVRQEWIVSTAGFAPGQDRVDPGLSPNPGDPSFQARIENNSFKFLFGWRRMKTVDKKQRIKICSCSIWWKIRDLQ